MSAGGPDAAPVVEPGRYRHYKGRYYEVLHVARHSQTLQWLVIYRALHGEHGLWVRPAAMFFERVQCDARAARRFEPCADCADLATGMHNRPTA